MTVSSTTTFELTRDQIIRRAMQLAQLGDPQESPDGNFVAMAADFMQMELQSLANEGVTLYQKERTTLALTASTAEYTLPTDVIDVVVGPDGFAGTIVDADNNETRVKAIDGHEYTLLSNKDAEATTPTFVYVEKRQTVRALFWPEPSANTTFRYQKVRLIFDMDTGARTTDLGRRWQKYLWLAMAWQLAHAASKPVETVSFLKKAAAEERALAVRSDREMTGGQFYVPRYGGGCV